MSSDILNSSVGSTMTPDVVRTQRVVANVTDTDVLRLNDEVDKVVHLDTGNNPRHLVSELALFLAKAGINKTIDEIKADLDNIFFSPVLSTAICSIHFADEYWARDEFVIDLTTAIYICKKHTKQDQARLKIVTEAVVAPGNHFFEIDIEELPSGRIDVYNERHEVIFTMNKPGIYWFLYDVENTSITYFDFVLSDMNYADTCKIRSIGVYRLRPEFESYMKYMMKQLLGIDLDGYVDEKELNTQLTDMKQELRQYTIDMVNNVTGGLENHLKDNTNPHDVDYKQVGAAPTVHKHSISDITNIYDILPVGTILQRHTSKDFDPFMLMNGRTLLIEQHQKLYTYAEEENLFVDESTWNTEINLSGFTDKFCKRPDGISFRIPVSATSLESYSSYYQGTINMHRFDFIKVK